MQNETSPVLRSSACIAARLGSKVAAQVTKALQMNWKRSMGASCVDFVTQNFSTTSQVRQMLANMEEWSSGAEVSKCFRDFTGGSEISKGQLLQVLNKILPGDLALKGVKKSTKGQQGQHAKTIRTIC